MYYLRWPPFWPPLSEDFTQLVEFLARDVVSLQGNSILVLWLQYQGIIIIFWFCAFIYLSKILILRELLRIPLTKCKLVSRHIIFFEFIRKLLHISTTDSILTSWHIERVPYQRLPAPSLALSSLWKESQEFLLNVPRLLDDKNLL